MKTIDSSKITWDIWQPDADDDWTQIYCPDGEGLIQVVVYPDRIELLDQNELCKKRTPYTYIDKIKKSPHHY